MGAITYERVDPSTDHARLVAFLTASTWPFHAVEQQSADGIARMAFVDDETISFWVVEDGLPVGLIRLFDLADLDEGSPLFDLRLAAEARGRGLGLRATTWLTSYLFDTYPELHRIEATTRSDNAAMQRVLQQTGYVLEGRLREAWRSATGERHDTLVYGILRSDR